MDEKIFRLTKEILKENFYQLEIWLSEHWNVETREYGSSLYHYTSIDTCSKIIASNSFFLMDSKFCNDASEYKEGLEYVRRYVSNGPSLFGELEFPADHDDQYQRHKYNNEILGPVYTDIVNAYRQVNPDWISYIACFSAPKYPHNTISDELLENDNLSMWRGYGQEGKGACLGISSVDLEDSIKDTENLVLLDVIYNTDQKKFFLKSLLRLAYDLYIAFNKIDIDNLNHAHNLEIKLRNITQDLDWDDVKKAISLAIHFIPSFFKHEGFEDEREVRLIYIPQVYKTIDPKVNFLGDGHDAKPYVNLSSIVEKKFQLPIFNITFGPQVTDKSYHNDFFMSGCRSICDEREIREFHSKIPYRS